MIDLSSIKRIHFLGIGGIGVSALARYFKLVGKVVTGYDRFRSPLCKQLESENIRISYDTESAKLAEVDLVVYTAALAHDNPILSFYQSKEIQLIKRAKLLAELCSNKKLVAVAGTHGKTTISSMIAHIFQQAGVKPTAFIGGIMNNYNSNFLFGEGDYIVAEADEYDRSFLQLRPQIAVISSTDADHLDVYKKADDLLASFRSFANQTASGGMLLLHELVSTQFQQKHQTYSHQLGSGADYQLTHYQIQQGKSEFQLRINKQLVTFELNMFGIHNIANAIAAIGVAFNIGIDITNIQNGLKSFKGIKRRFERVIANNEVIYYDDYAHHPSELEVLLGSLKEMHPNQTIHCIFQPHLFSRTKDFYQEFGKALSIADKVYLLPIYPARELPIKDVGSKLIADAMSKPNILISKEEMLKELEDIHDGVLVTAGAGDIDELIPNIKGLIKERQLND